MPKCKKPAGSCLFLLPYVFKPYPTFMPTKIGLISDTHGWLDPQVFHFFEHVDQIWHGGDIGTAQVTNDLAQFKPLKAVWGNIDGPELRQQFEECLVFTVEDLKVMLLHIGGKPPRYKPGVKKLLKQHQPDVFMVGHSHMLAVAHDADFERPEGRPPLLFLNPGAAGRQGFHKMRTLLRFEINGTQIQNMQAIELGPRGR